MNLPDHLRPLINGLSLTDGFEFDLIIAPDPHTLQHALEEVCAQVEALRGEPVQIITHRYDRAQYGPPHHTDIILKLLPALLDARPQPGEPFTLHLLDATHAPPEDEDPWVILFARMNELRNNLRDTLGYPLLLALPPFLEGPFSRMAGDFWSIRSARVTLPRLDPPVAQLPALLLEAPPIPPERIPSLTILHMAGLRFGSTTERDLNPILQALWADLEHLAEAEDLHPDFLVISGDLTAAGTYGDVERFQERFLDPFFNATRLGAHAYVFAPGPTDSLRDPALLRTPEALQRTAPEELEHVFIERSQRYRLFDRFLPFSALLRSLQELQLTNQEPAVLATYTPPRGPLRIGFAAFNSAWLTLPDQPRPRLAAAQLTQAAQRLDAEGANLRIAVLHDHPDSLPQADADALRRAHHLILCAAPTPDTPPLQPRAQGEATTISVPSFSGSTTTPCYQLLRLGPTPSLRRRAYNPATRAFEDASTAEAPPLPPLYRPRELPPRRVVPPLEAFIFRARAEALTPNEIARLRRIGGLNSSSFPPNKIKDKLRGFAVAEYVALHPEDEGTVEEVLPEVKRCQQTLFRTGAELHTSGGGASAIALYGWVMTSEVWPWDDPIVDLLFKDNMASFVASMGIFGVALDLDRWSIAWVEAEFPPNSPPVARAWRNLLATLVQMGDVEQATTTAHRMLEFDNPAIPLDDQLQFKYLLAKLMCLRNNPEPALEFAEQYLATTWSARIEFIKGWAILLLGREIEAQAQWSKTLARLMHSVGYLHPNTALFQHHLAQLLISLGRHTEAQDLRSEMAWLLSADEATLHVEQKEARAWLMEQEPPPATPQQPEE